MAGYDERMKRIFPSILILSLSLILNPTAHALSCEQTYPRVATISDFALMENGDLKLMLKWVYSFPEESIRTNPLLFVDDYSEVAKKYAEDELDEFTNLEDENASWNYSETIIKKDFYTKLNLADSDIIVTGPPMYLCSDSFVGIFDKNAKLKQLIFRGEYQDLSFLGYEIKIDLGKEIECMGYSCSVKTLFEIEEKEYTLVPSQEANLEEDLISKIFLLSSSAPAKGVDVEKLFPWGGGRLVEYLMEFNVSLQEESKAEEGAEIEDPEAVSTTSIEDGTSSSSPALNIHDAQEEKPKNAIMRFFAWIKSLFTK